MKNELIELSWVHNLQLYELDALLRVVIEARQKKLDEKREQAHKILQDQMTLQRQYDTELPFKRSSDRSVK